MKLTNDDYKLAQEILCKWGTFMPKKVKFAINIALVAIDKQISKPKHKFDGYRCVCSSLVAKNQDYCETCGQHLLPFEEKNLKRRKE